MGFAGLPALHLRQAQAYYEAALSIVDKTNVVPNQKAAFYKAMLKDDECRLAPLTVPVPEPVALQDFYDDGICVAGDDDEEAIPVPALEDVRAEEMDIAGDVPPEVDLAAAEVAAFDDDAYRFPDRIEGAIAYLEHFAGYRHDGAFQEYERLRVRCRNPAHENCGTSRIISYNSTARLGKREVVAYLGAWLQMHDNFAERAAHIKWRPSFLQTKLYFDENLFKKRVR